MQLRRIERGFCCEATLCRAFRHTCEAEPGQHKGWALKGRRQGQIPRNKHEHKCRGQGAAQRGVLPQLRQSQNKAASPGVIQAGWPELQPSAQEAGLSCSHQLIGFVGFSCWCCPLLTLPLGQQQPGRRALASPTSEPAAEPAAPCQLAAGHAQQQQQWHGRRGAVCEQQRGGGAARATPSQGGGWASQCGYPEALSAPQSHSAGWEGRRR